MKKQQQKLNIKINIQASLLAIVALLLSQTVLAHKSVVVIPIAGDDIPAISHPVATTFTNSIGMQFNELPAGSSPWAARRASQAEMAMKWNTRLP